MKIRRLAFVMLAVFSLVSCSSDSDNEDKVEQITVYVSAETGVYYDIASFLNVTPQTISKSRKEITFGK